MKYSFFYLFFLLLFIESSIACKCIRNVSLDNFSHVKSAYLGKVVNGKFVIENNWTDDLKEIQIDKIFTDCDYLVFKEGMTYFYISSVDHSVNGNPFFKYLSRNDCDALAVEITESGPGLGKKELYQKYGPKLEKLKKN